MARPGLSPLRIALVSEQRSDYLKLGYSEEECAALTHQGEVEAVMTTLQKLGHEVTPITGIESLVQSLAAGDNHNWDLVFNMSQGFHGPARESQVPSLLEAYHIPYTFADAATMALCQNKGNAKAILDRHHIPSAPFVTISGDAQRRNLSGLADKLPPYPVFVKLLTEGSSKGIDHSSKVENAEELEAAVQKLTVMFPEQDIIVEPFLPGREFTVSILDTDGESKVIGVREHLWQKSPTSDEDKEDGHVDNNFATRKSKNVEESILEFQDHDLRDTKDPQIITANLVALDAWNALGCRDAGRVDIRFDSDGPNSVPNVLEVNPISGLLPDHSPLPSSALKNGISFEQLLASIVQNALQRTDLENQRSCTRLKH